MSDSDSSSARSDRYILDSDSDTTPDGLSSATHAVPQQTLHFGESRGTRPPRNDQFLNPGTNQDLQSPFMDILDIITQFGPTVIDLDRLGDLTRPGVDDARITCALGSGATAKVIRHVTDNETDDIVKSGTSIALKVFSPADWTSFESRREAMNSVRREVQVLCDLTVARHPNIVKLLFVGFQTENPYPIIAMELGKYGSLDHVLRDSGAGPSHLQRLHITMDIACGMRHLHQSGLIHGDLKPDNIIIFDHQREGGVIAKITDFGGSHSTTPSYVFMPHITEIWCAPEVLNRDVDIDWEKADAYSYGLVIASLYARPVGFETQERRSSCFLSSFVPRNIEGKDLTQFLWVLKASDENHSGVASLARKSVPSNYIDKLDLILPTLNRYFWLRPSLSQVLDSLASIPDFMRLDRTDTSNESGMIRTQLRPRENIHKFKVWSQDLYGRNDSFRSYVLQQLCEDFGDLHHFSALPVVDIPADIKEMNPPAFLDMLFRAIQNLPTRSRFSDEGSMNVMWTRGRCAFHIAVCHLLGLGTELDVEESLKWLRVSAMLGWPLAIYHCPLLQDEEDGFPTRLFLCLGALDCSPLALAKLAKYWPNIFRTIRNIFRSSNLGYLRPSAASHDLFLLQYLDYWQSATFVDAASEIHDEESCVEEILRVGTIHEALHSLSILIDDEAASLAKPLFERGAKLDCIRPARGAFYPTGCGVLPELGSQQEIVVSPLSGAIRRGQRKLASAILDIHIDQEILIPDMTIAYTMSIGWWHVDIARRLLQLQRTSPDLCLRSEGPLSNLSPASEPTLMLRASLADRDMMHTLDLEKRAIHGSGYEMAYEQTLEFLISEGANILHMRNYGQTVQVDLDTLEIDPNTPRGLARFLEASARAASARVASARVASAGRRQRSTFYTSLVSDDLTAVAVFVRHIRSTSLDLMAWLDSPHLGPSAEGLESNVLQVCIQERSPACFYFLLNNFPGLANHRNGNGNTPLHSACYNRQDVTLVEALLEHGADFTVPRWSNKPYNATPPTPLAVALWHGNVVAAELISARCSETQLRSLLARSPETGMSIFYGLLSQWVSRPSSELLDSFRWLIRMGGAHFFGASRLIEGDPPVLIEGQAWFHILRKRQSPTRADVLRDLELVRLLFDFFPHQLDQDYGGYAPLHLAALKGHVEIVRELVRRHVNVNKEMGESHDPSFPSRPGHTALDILAMMQSVEVPDEIQRRGAVEERRWKEDMSTIGEILISAGARSGSRAHLSTMLRGMSMDPKLGIFVSDLSFQDKSVQSRRHPASWPLELPRDSSSCESRDSSDRDRMTEIRRFILQSLAPSANLTPSANLEGPIWSQTEIENCSIQGNFMRAHWRLPPGWKVRRTDKGDLYYVDHYNKITTWQKPVLYSGNAQST